MYSIETEDKWFSRIVSFVRKALIDDDLMMMRPNVEAAVSNNRPITRANSRLEHDAGCYPGRIVLAYTSDGVVIVISSGILFCKT